MSEDTWEGLTKEQRELSWQEDMLKERFRFFLSTHEFTAEQLDSMLDDLPVSMPRFLVIHRIEKEFPEYWQKMVGRSHVGPRSI